MAKYQYDMAIKQGKIYYDGDFTPLNIYIKKGIIQEISLQDHSAKQTLDAQGKLVIPGIIDPHVHFALNTGTFTSADDFVSGSRAGLLGGVTSFIDFLEPVDQAPEIEQAFLRRKKKAEGSFSDYTFHVTATNPVGQTRQITQKAIELKIPSIKIFTAYSESERRTYENEIAEFLELSEQQGTILLVHAEDEEYLKHSVHHRPADLPLSRPVKSELSMVKKLAELVELKGGRLYMVHTSCGESLEIMSKKYPQILNSSFFMESCPQYFYLDDRIFKTQEGYKYILAPPLRPKRQQRKLQHNFQNIYSIGTDHCPFTQKQKNLPFLKDIPFGIGGIEFSFPLMYSLYGKEAIPKMTEHPAKLFNLYPNKGILAEGSQADCFIYDPKIQSTAGMGHSRCDYNLYEQIPLKGRVVTTILRGQLAMDQGKIFPARGQFIEREINLESH
ncbi:MAG: amidohydrolase family protein [Spirochaetaceae bacterium]|jgi:dihydropyrimidinase|nr:amidohydrolase family protein [Spirochaetaceae bacterium]